MTKGHQSHWSLANVGAVPHTGRRSRGRWFRGRRNIGAKRAIIATCGTIRGEDVPPSSWDDIARRPQRSWKEHRRYRWRDAP